MRWLRFLSLCCAAMLLVQQSMSFVHAHAGSDEEAVPHVHFFWPWSDSHSHEDEHFPDEAPHEHDGLAFHVDRAVTLSARIDIQREPGQAALLFAGLIDWSFLPEPEDLPFPWPNAPPPFLHGTLPLFLSLSTLLL